MTEQQVKSLREVLDYTAPEALAWKIGMMIDDAVETEREACAAIADNYAIGDRDRSASVQTSTATDIAAHIRQRT